MLEEVVASVWVISASAKGLYNAFSVW